MIIVDLEWNLDSSEKLFNTHFEADLLKKTLKVKTVRDRDVCRFAFKPNDLKSMIINHSDGK